jgi:hypothetical protein
VALEFDEDVVVAEDVRERFDRSEAFFEASACESLCERAIVAAR